MAVSEEDKAHYRSRCMYYIHSSQRRCLSPRDSASGGRYPSKGPFICPEHHSEAKSLSKECIGNFKQDLSMGKVAGVGSFTAGETAKMIGEKVLWITPKDPEADTPIIFCRVANNSVEVFKSPTAPLAVIEHLAPDKLKV